MSFKNKFSNLGQPEKVWVVSAVNGDRARLVELHKTLFDKIKSGDRLLYTGNYLAGPGASPVETLDEILYFRRTLLARPGMQDSDFVYLRGIQEELWNKILQLQFTPSPGQVLEWMMKKHPNMESVLRGYGSSFEEASRLTREGVINLTRWTTSLKQTIRQHPGHEKFFSVLRRAAFTEHSAGDDGNILFVHAGLDPQLPLISQGDNFWWASKQFSQIQEAYHPFKLVVRGFDPDHQGLKIGPAAVSLDGDRMLCAEMSGQGDVLNVLAA
jgi:serine/threonine protein phosphatase 1